MPDSSQKAKAVPTWTPTAPRRRASRVARAAVGTGEPERQADALDLLEVGRVALAVDRFAGGAEFHGAAGRRVVAAGGRAFDHEAVDLAA